MEKNRIKKLRRHELLNMLIEITKENETLRKELDETKKQLNDKTIKIEKAGSIAMAALEINNIFEIAQKAADQYLESIKSIEVVKDEKIKKIDAEVKEKPKRGRKPKVKNETEIKNEIKEEIKEDTNKTTKAKSKKSSEKEKEGKNNNKKQS